MNGRGTDTPPAAAELLAAATLYTPRAIALHGITASGACTCAKAECPTPGKHPRRAGWKTSSPADDRHELATRLSNVGVRTGGGLVVVDVDPRNGGADTLAALQRDLGSLPDTPTVETGGDGLHLYLSGPNSLRSITLGPGVEIKAGGRQVVAPPSLHVSGRRYRWNDKRPFAATIAVLPTGWAERIGSRAVATALGGGPQLSADGDVLKAVAPPEYVRVLAGVELAGRTSWSRNGHGDPRAALCPFHDDHRHPNLLVWDTPAGGWLCNTCGIGGGIYEFAAALWGVAGPLRGPNFLGVRERLLDTLLAHYEAVAA